MRKNLTTLEHFVPFVVPAKAHLMSNAAEYAGRARDDAQTIQRLKNERMKASFEIARLTERVKERKSTVRNLEKQARSIKVPAKRLHREWERLVRHPDIAKVTITPNKLGLITQPLFTEIRLNEDTKETRRAFIGVFRIMIASGDSMNIVIDNLSFPKMNNPHWSVGSSSHIACQGDWTEIFTDCRARGNWALFVTNLMQYLRSSEDGAAYDRCHRWRDRRQVYFDFPVSDKWGVYTMSYEHPETRLNVKVVDMLAIQRYNVELGVTTYTLENGHVVRRGDTYIEERTYLFNIKNIDNTDSFVEARAIYDEYVSRLSNPYILNLIDTLPDDIARANMALLSKTITEKVLVLDPIPNVSATGTSTEVVIESGSETAPTMPIVMPTTLVDLADSDSYSTLSSVTTVDTGDTAILTAEQVDSMLAELDEIPAERFPF